MIRTVGVLCTFLFFLSCKKGTLNNCTDDTYAYEFFTASKIDTLTNPGGIFYDIKSGSNIVFQYTHVGPDCKNVADEEYTEFLVFQIPAALNSFQFENNKLADVLTLFKKLCFCPTNASAVTSGSIKGTRISSSKWDIQINIELPGTSQKIEVTRIFLLK
jgi:hypothetical protein